VVPIRGILAVTAVDRMEVYNQRPANQSRRAVEMVEHPCSPRVRDSDSVGASHLGNHQRRYCRACPELVPAAAMSAERLSAVGDLELGPVG
jgi:hypothetical protein